MRVPLAGVSAALCLSGSLAACHARPPAPDVVATSTLGEIRRVDVDAYILTQPEKRRGPGEGQDTKVWRRSLVEEMLSARSLEAEGKKNGVLDEPEAKAWLQGQIDAVLVEEIKARRVAAAVKITNADVKTFYDTHPKDVSHTGQIRLRNIYRRVARDASPAEREAVRKETQDLLRQIRGGANFEEMARQHSQSETAPQGGLIGRLNHGDLSRSVEAIVWKLKDGEVSDVVGTSVGFQIFKLDNHIAPFKMDFAEAQPRLAKRLVREATERTLKDQIQELVTASGAVYHPEGVSDPDPQALLFSLGSDRITRADWDKAFGAKPFPAQRESPLRDLVDDFVGQRLRLWEARRVKLDQEPAMAARLAGLRRETTVRLAREQRLKALVAKKETEVKAFYAANAPRYMTAKLHHLRLITLPFPPEGVDYAVFERLQALGNDIRAGRRTFADVAKQVSSDFTGSRGGDLGFVRLDALGEWAGPRAFTNLEKLKLDEVSEPILIERYDRNLLTYHREGYMLVVIEAVQEPRTRPLEAVRDEVDQDYMGKQFAPIMTEVRQSILASIRAQIYDQNL